MKLKTAIILILILLAILISGQSCEQRECYTNQDCVKVQITCCPCNNGGTEQCVSRLMAKVYEDKLKNCPPQEKLICPAVYNCKNKNCSCVKGRCS